MDHRHTRDWVFISGITFAISYTVALVAMTFYVFARPR